MTNLTFNEIEKSAISEAITSNTPWSSETLAPLKTKIKQHYVTKQKRRCCYCNQKFPTTHGRAWDIEHVLPQSKFPQFRFEILNLAVACIECNSAKSDKQVHRYKANHVSLKSEDYEIIHPNIDNWRDHIKFGKALYAPLTPKGTTTILVCNLTRFINALKDEQILVESPRLDEEIENLTLATSLADAEPSIEAIRAIMKQQKPKKI